MLPIRHVMPYRQGAPGPLQRVFFISCRASAAPKYVSGYESWYRHVGCLSSPPRSACNLTCTNTLKALYQRLYSTYGTLAAMPHGMTSPTYTQRATLAGTVHNGFVLSTIASSQFCTHALTRARRKAGTRCAAPRKQIFKEQQAPVWHLPSPSFHHYVCSRCTRPSSSNRP